MATGTLTSTTIASTYKSLLKVKGGANTVLHSTTHQLVEDGDGNDSVLSLAIDSVGITGSGSKLYFSDKGGEYLSGDGTDLTITSGTDILLTVGGVVGINTTVPAAVSTGISNFAPKLDIRGGTGTGVATAGSMILSTAETTIADGDYLGMIAFQAPLEGSGSDAILSPASIHAEAEVTFDGSSNSTSIVFSTADSTAPIERMRIHGEGNVGIGTATPLTQLHMHGSSTTALLFQPQYGQIGNNIFFDGSAWDSFNDSATGGVFAVGTTGDFSFRRATAADPPVLSYSMYISPTGNVGMGDSDPSEARVSISSVLAGDYALKIDQDQNKEALIIDTEATSEDAIEIDTPTQNTGHILNIEAVDALTTGSAIRVDCGSTALTTTGTGGLVEILYDANAGSTSNNLLFILNDDVNSTGTVPLTIQQDAAGKALFIDQNANHVGISIDAENTTNPAFYIESDVLTTGSVAEFTSNAPDNTSSRNIVFIVNNNAAADKAVGLLIQQDGDDAHIEFTGAGGGGIKFTADIASSDSDTLDDYEEGTWTPANPAYNTCTGLYTKVGRLVTLNARIVAGSQSAGAEISLASDAPFTCTSTNGGSGGGAMMGLSVLGDYGFVNINNSTTTMTVLHVTATANLDVLTFSMSYLTD